MHRTSPSKWRGRRECRMQAAPMARLQQKKQAAVTTGKAGTTGIPCATVLTAASCSPWSAGLDSLHRLRIVIRKLGPSVGGSGPHDLAVRGGCAARRAAPRASIASPPRVRDDAFAPLIEAGWKGKKHGFRKNGRRIFSWAGLERSEGIEGAREISVKRRQF